MRPGSLVIAGAMLACTRAAAPDRCLQIEFPRAPLGFDAPFSIGARWTCAGHDRGRIVWRQLAGPPLLALVATAEGFTVTARSPSLETARGPDPVPWGVLPLSPRTRGEIALEASWSDASGRALRREIRLAAAPRSRGLSNTPVATRVYLGGGAWSLAARPAGSSATLEAPAGSGSGTPPSLVPDVSGDYRLRDTTGHELVLRSGRYDETPLDCGRSGCHEAITSHAARSPMTGVLARGLTPGPDHRPGFGPGYPGCALACHATGEPGLADGGFVHVAHELGVDAGARTTWKELPQPLRRLGGVGCLACHGPAALPPPSARASLLRADVCAVCHDAPPRYGHVVAWRAGAMSRADRDDRARREPACARCHTTAGFLATLAQPPPGTAQPPRLPNEPTGIACAACHSVHGDETGQPPGALLRTPEPPTSLRGARTDARSAVCLPCHAPSDATSPAASAAAIWLGRGGVEPASGAPLDGAAIHAGVEGGCVGCHRGGPNAVEHGTGHAFAATAGACGACHPRGIPVSDVGAQASRLWEAWRMATGEAGLAAGPVHASTPMVDRQTPLGRAGWNVRLVLEDRGAAAHNGRYARALLAAAEPVIAAANAGRGGKR